MLTALHFRAVAWLARNAGLHLLTDSQLAKRLQYAYLDGWDDAESRAEARGPCDVR